MWKIGLCTQILEFRSGDNDPRICDGILSLVPASKAVVDSSIKSAGDHRNLVRYSDIANAQEGKAFDDKGPVTPRHLRSTEDEME
jgi:hypothetical protein